MRWSKTYIDNFNTFGVTVCFNSYQTSKTRYVLHPIRTCFFVSCPLLDATEGNFKGKVRR